MMGLVTARSTTDTRREVYLPTLPSGMAHVGEISPDGRFVLLAEMDFGKWLPCRVVALDGSVPDALVGPQPSQCTAGRWSPDGRWIYLTASVDGESHIWRQPFPEGRPEQLTSGPVQEADLAVAPDGTLVASVFARQNTVWLHDARGDRQISGEGIAFKPRLSPDEQTVYYLVRRPASGSFWAGELWAADVATGRNHRVLPNFVVRSFDVSSDGREIVFDAIDERDPLRVWLASVDGTQPPSQLTSEESLDEERPFFGASGSIYLMEKLASGENTLARTSSTNPERVIIRRGTFFLVNISPDERWAALWNFEEGATLFPLAGGAAHRICGCGMGPLWPDSPKISWSGNGTTFFVADEPPPGGGRGFVTPWRGVVAFTAGSMPSPAAWRSRTGTHIVRDASVALGLTAETYVFTRPSEQSNVFRIAVPAAPRTTSRGDK
jgi:WD40 repeat protein